MSIKSFRQMSKIFPLSTLSLGMGLGIHDANAINTRIVDMLFSGDYRATGSIDFDAGTGSFTSKDKFFSSHWTATVVQTFTTPGDYVFAGPGGVPGDPNTKDPVNDTLAIQSYNYQFTLQPGQVAAGLFFDWSTNFDIPVLSIYDCSNPDTGCRAAGPGDSTGNNIGGVPMVTQPFAGQAPAFNGTAPGAVNPDGAFPVLPAPPLVLANDVSGLNAGFAVTIPWTPNLTGSTTPTCTIVQTPSQGTATVQPDCSSGSYTSGAAAANVSFVYRVSVPGGDSFAPGAMNTDDGTVSVSVSNIVPPTAVNDTASAAVGTAVGIDVLVNDSATGGASLVPASVTVTQAPTKGTVTSIDPVTGIVSYLPNPGFCGADSFKYTVADDQPLTSADALVTVAVESNGQLCSSDDGVTISGGPSDPNNDGLVSLSDLLSAGIPQDGGVLQPCVGGCFDFRATGVTGTTATFVLPLSQLTPIAPLMRKWNGSAWVNFVAVGADSVATATKIGGRCPDPGTGYTDGISPGKECIRLIISDGGPNDADGIVNGEIVDPSGVGSENIPSAGTELGSASGCTIGNARANPARHFDWAFLLGFIGVLCFWRKKQCRQAKGQSN